jgi:hypothetical protein
VLFLSAGFLEAPPECMAETLFCARGVNFAISLQLNEIARLIGDCGA